MTSILSILESFRKGKQSGQSECIVSWSFIYLIYTAPKVSKYGVFSGAHFPVFGLIRKQENTDQKKLRIWTLFTQCHIPKLSYYVANSPSTDRSLYVTFSSISSFMMLTPFSFDITSASLSVLLSFCQFFCSSRINIE